MEPIDYLRALKRRWPIVAVATLIGAIAAFLTTPAEPTPIERSYLATHTMLVADPTLGIEQRVGTVTLAQVPLFTTTGEVPRRVADQLGWTGAPAALAAEVQAEVDAQTGTLRVSSQQPDPERAVLLADAFADETAAFLAERQEELRQRRLTSTLNRMEVQQQRAQEADDALRADPENGVLKAQRDAAVRAYGATYESYQNLTVEETEDLSLTTLERAQPVEVETGGFEAPRSRAARVPIAAGIGFLLGCGLAIVVDRLDERIRDRRRAEQAYGVPVVAELPSLRRRERGTRLLVGPAEHTHAAESYRTLRTSLAFLAAEGENPPRCLVVLVTSASPAEGKTTVAANLAAAFAETGQKVVVANADFRRPKIGRFFAWWRSDPSVSLSGNGRPTAERLLAHTAVDNLQFLDVSGGQGTPGDLVRATAQILSELRSTVDVIIIDTPPLSVTAESLEFAPLATVSLLLARLDRSTVSAAARAQELLRFGGASLVVLAITEAGQPSRRRYRYYGYYSGSADESGKAGKPGKRAGKRTGGPLVPGAELNPPAWVPPQEVSGTATPGREPG
jgi:Mrp family chromosome partitioning ATPase